ncbi:MAG TPA: co-chaperone GroES [Candidatus Saccharimonadales bacterium]
MSLKPLRDFLVVSVVKKEEKLASGLFIPTTVDEKIVTGTVLSVGSGYLTDSGTIVPLEVQAGDTIVFNKQMSVEVKHGGETVLLLREEHILSVVQ